ncbi:MAG: SDR family oxidoreductase [bacterium]|nr:SDR family oxidoreductase [bacterium]
MTHILVTGGAGFIGSNLCRRLLTGGHRVTCLDNFVTGKKQNIQDLLDHDSFELVEHDVTASLQLDCNQIYHLACPASPPQYQHDPIFKMKTSVIGTLNMLELARKNNCPILHASTSEVYGDPLEHPQKESYWGHVNPIGPRACYDEGKRAAETLCVDYQRQYGTEVKIVRIFNTYGPYMDPADGRVVSNFIVQALRKQSLTAYGNGSQTRSFQYVDDLIDGLLAMMAVKNFSGPVNLGNPDEFSVLELAQKVLKLTGSSSTISFQPLPEDDPSRRRPDISLAQEKLDWKPQINLEQGLKKTIDYFRTRI